MPHVDEETVKAAFIRAFNDFVTYKDDVIAAYRAIIDTLTDCSALDAEDASLRNEHEVVAGLIQRLVDENARTAIDQENYTARYNELVERYEATEARLAANQSAGQGHSVRREKLMAIIDRIKAQDGLLTEFDEELWNATVESVTVQYGRELEFKFKGQQ